MSRPKSGFILPSDVHQWLRSVFRSCNERISSKLNDCPTTHESSLDLTFVEHFSRFQAPVVLPSGWKLRFETHFLGGGHHFGTWEIADIGLLLMLRQSGRTKLNKVALLQSKRLYPDEQEFDETTMHDYCIGFRRLFEQDDEWCDVSRAQVFSIQNSSRYKALHVRDDQYKAIEAYEKKFKIPVYYLLYHPWQLPWTVAFPLHAGRPTPLVCDVGCRVIPGNELRTRLLSKNDNESPTFLDLSGCCPKTSLSYSENWTLEDFAVDLLISCQTGYVAPTPEDPGLERVFNLRSGPISAALSITVDAPENANFEM